MQELWNVNATLARLNARYLRAFKRAISISGATPACFSLTDDGEIMKDGFEKWTQTIDKMIFAFDWYAGEYEPKPGDEADKVRIRVKEGLRLFAEYYGDLWY